MCTCRYISQCVCLAVFISSTTSTLLPNSSNTISISSSNNISSSSSSINHKGSSTSSSSTRRGDSSASDVVVIVTEVVVLSSDTLPSASHRRISTTTNNIIALAVGGTLRYSVTYILLLPTTPTLSPLSFFSPQQYDGQRITSVPLANGARGADGWTGRMFFLYFIFPAEREPALPCSRGDAAEVRMLAPKKAGQSNDA